MIWRKLLGEKGYKTVKAGLWGSHPIFYSVLGICSALAITNRVENAIAMGLGVTFVLAATAILVSSLRKMIPARVRIITYMIVISSFVIIVDRVLKALFPTVSEAIGPYVGLIITNCIIMGRAEAFYIQENPYYSVLDALANGFAYSYTLIILSIMREVLAFGTILRFKVVPAGWTNWTVMSMAPGAFFLLGLLIWISRSLSELKAKEAE